MDTPCALATKQVALPLDVKEGDTPGTFEGYGAVFGNRDRDGDIVARGAFAESLKSGMPVLLWQHDQKEPIGRFDDVREDDKGLYVKGRLSMAGRGEEAYQLLKMGALDGLSIGFVTKEASRDPASATRTITKADLMEISLVTFPANELARVSAVKAATHMQKDDMLLETPASDARSFERMLRENGFSRTRAKAITAKGFKAVDMSADASAEIADMVAELKQKKEELEVKASLQVKLTAGPNWSAWATLPAVTFSKSDSFKISAQSRNPGRTKGPFKLKIKYTSKSGQKIATWLSNGGSAGNGPYKVPEGMQEVSVSAKAMGLPQRIIVSLR